jgi:hypothetical protein
MKIFDEIKKYLNDNYFGKVECEHCKKTGRVRKFFKTKDGKFICGNCQFDLPTTIRENVAESEYEEIEEILSYVDYSKRELAPKFRETLKYEYFSVDAVNGLFKIFGGSPVLELKNIEMYSFDFEPTEGREGLISATVTGNVNALIITNSPKMCYNEIVALMVKGKAKKKLGGSIYYYENPKKLDEFLEKFEPVLEKFRQSNNTEISE